MMIEKPRGRSKLCPRVWNGVSIVAVCVSVVTGAGTGEISRNN